MEHVCSDTECNLKCYLSAIGDCYKEDRLFNMDPKVIKVVGRAICDNRQGIISPLNLCPVNNQTCVDEFNSAWTEASVHLMSGDYTEFKRSLCRASKDFRACVDVTVTSTCISSIAEQARNIYQVGYSYAACGPQDHAYFTKYGGDVDCITSANSRLMTSFIEVMLFTVILMMWL
ncbi:uncharacterized protein LOC128555347 [Mercenaria mercenaria]|uniref:uncharacterized protein LOC128555347 n=1 Tax=Mercenaria mercenaria TaxID=6596 RepID=UPI00234F04F0|nr:uncharacterized protein LOC128555347 [Mercenaria mercenaria]